MPAPLLNDIAPPPNSFVLPKQRIVCIQVTKAASSSLRWMIADMAGEDFDRFYRASGAHQSRYMTIHTPREVWQHVPHLPNLSPDELAEISRDNGWFIFTVVRDPWTRLWSAWQSKFLVQHTPYVREYRDQPWFPRVPSTPADVVDDWATFVAAQPWVTHRLLKADQHFQTQFGAARPRGVNYTRIYDLTEMAVLESDIHAHLSRLGLDQELYLPRANENPVPMPAEALDTELAESIRASYEADVAEWGDRWDLEEIRGRCRPISIESVRGVERLVIANQRIGDLSRELKSAEQRVAKLERRPPVAAPTKPQPPRAAEAGVPAGFAELRRKYRWPSRPRYPEVEPAGRPTRGFELVAEAAAALSTAHPVILDIGAELGESTRQCLAIPGSYVVSIDPWKADQTFEPWPVLTEFTGVRNAALDLFQSFHFEHRARLVALRDYSPRGLVRVHKAGLRPDIVYLDGDRRTDAVLRDITVTAALFPRAIICGAGWIWRPKRNVQNYRGVEQPVRAAVSQWASFRDHFVDTRENTWRIDPSRKFNLPDEAGEGATYHADARQSLNRDR
ncbi:MAG TPA: sulfotransferase family 2 domain-containing protein [Jatrophihabitantaceae bacterium]|nr:sulfotransferase family 2 domain-containing protein [Jatrophihabitantaceae bacterium]